MQTILRSFTFFFSQVKSSQLEIIPLSQDRLLDAVHILVWYPVDEIPDNEEGVIRLYQ